MQSSVGVAGTCLETERPSCQTLSRISGSEENQRQEKAVSRTTGTRIVLMSEYVKRKMVWAKVKLLFTQALAWVVTFEEKVDITIKTSATIAFDWIVPIYPVHALPSRILTQTEMHTQFGYGPS